MAKNAKSGSNQKPVQKKVTSTPVRNSPIPKTATKPVVAAPVAKAPISKPPSAPVAKAAPAAAKSNAPKTVTHDAIAKRAYEIHLSGSGGSETDNWHRAERELRGH